MKTLASVSCLLGLALLYGTTLLLSASAQQKHQIRNRNRGSITWKGHVDQVMEVSFQESRTWTKQIRGRKGSGDAVFSSAIPRKSVQMTVHALEGRGRLWIQQQPSRSNAFTCVVRLADQPSGGDQYKFSLTWDN